MSDATEVVTSAGTFGFDAAVVEPGTNEELAGPPHDAATRPVERQERVASVDVLRGFALLGILLMNITSFGLPSWAYAIPLSTSLPVFSGPHARVNTVVWFLRWVLAEGQDACAVFDALWGGSGVADEPRGAAWRWRQDSGHLYAKEYVVGADWDAAWLPDLVWRHSLLVWADGTAVSLSVPEAEGEDAGVGRHAQSSPRIPCFSAVASLRVPILRRRRRSLRIRQSARASR